MKAAFIKLVTGNFPRIKTAATAGACGLVAWLFTKFGIEMKPETQSDITVLTVLVVGWTLDALAAKIGYKQAKTVQDLLAAANFNVKIDGNIGKVTIGTLVDVLREAGYSIPEPVTTSKKTTL